MSKNMPAALKFFGGKRYLSAWLGSMLPPHIHRVHLYAGGLGEAKTWPIQGYSLVANDIYGLLINFYRVLQSDQRFKDFMRQVGAVPFSREEWEAADELCADSGGYAIDGREQVTGIDVTRAAAFFIWNRQSMGGRMEGFTPLTRKRTRGSRNAEVNSWLSSIDGLEEFKAYIDNYVLECDEAINVMLREDGPGTFFYADPPYLPSKTQGEGRSTRKVYAFEMSEERHKDLLGTSLCVEGKVMISGYRSELYDDLLAKWDRHDKVIDNKAAKSKEKRKMTESVWLNYKKP